MISEDNLQLLLQTLQFWERREKEKAISEEGLELLQSDVDIVFQFMNSKLDDKGHFDGCSSPNRLREISSNMFHFFQTNSNSCGCYRFNFALFRMKHLDIFYR